MNSQKVERFSPKKLASESFDNDNKLTLKSFLAAWCVCFNKDQRRRDGNDFQTDAVSGFQNTPELKRAKTYRALSFDRINFFNMANLFSLSRKPFVKCYCVRELIKTLFFDACQMIVKSRVLHLFPVPQIWEKPHNKHLISPFFSVCTVNYGSSFFSSDLWPARKKLGP